MKKNSNILRLFGYVRPYWEKLLIAMVFAGIVSITTGSVAWVVKPILDDIFLMKDETKLYIVPIVFVALYFVKGLARYGQCFLMRVVGLKVIRNIRNDLYSHIMSMPLQFFHRNSSSLLMSRVTNDVSRITEIATVVAAELVRQVLTFFVLLAVILYQNWFLTVLALCVFPFVSLFIYKIGKKLKELSRKNQEKMADLNTILMETFTGNKIVKAFVMEEYEKKRFGDENETLFKISVKEAKRDEIVSPLMEFVGAIGAGLVILYGGIQVVNGTTTPGTFFSFLAAITMMYEPIRKLSKINNSIQQALAAGDRIFEILDIGTGIDESTQTKEMSGFSKSITFNRIKFRYKEDQELVLKGITLEVKKGEVIALVGNSGAGKSTFIDMIPRYYDPEDGEILLDGINIRDLRLNNLRGMIGVVTQEVILFNDTIFNNIAYGRKEASEEEVINAAKLAYCHKFILDMPEKYNTVIGERGLRLSGGERQRISIARAILKNPLILLLDEATSNLDSESESLVQNALENLMKDRTTFVIAHRLSTVINADRIVVFSDGQIIECGTHSELLTKNGFYRALYDIQFNKKK